MKNNTCMIILIVLLSFQAKAQQILTKKEALKITLENNYGIKIATNNLAIAKNNTACLLYTSDAADE